VFESILQRGVEPIRWLIVLGVAYTLAKTIWVFFDTPVATSATAIPDSARTTTATPPANLNWILARHMFGEAGAAPVVAAQTQNAVQTSLPLELQSVFVADSGEQSAAIVAQRGKPGRLYHVGDDLPGNAKLVEVATDHIILSRAGSRETLMFPKIQVQFTPTDLEQDQAQESHDMHDDAAETDHSTNNAEQAQDSPVDELNEYKARLNEDAAGTLAELGIEPVGDAAAEEAGGYRIGNLTDSPYLQQTGLQPGDIIHSVNGRAVGNIEQDQLEIDNILAQGSARIEVQRGSRRFFITVSLK
jgi:general secretion pathway protein C